MTISIEAFQERIGLKRRTPTPPDNTHLDKGEEIPDDDFEFPPNVVPSENRFIFPDHEAIAEHLDEQSRSVFDDHYEEFHSGFIFKIRNELVAQIFRSFNDTDIPEGSIDFMNLAEMMQKEVTSEKNFHFMQAQYLDVTAIPAARTRPVFSESYSGNPSAYLERDIPHLEAREEAHLAMNEYLDAFLPVATEERVDFAEQLARQFLPEAKNEALKILTEQITEQEAKRRAIDEQIEALNARKAILTGEAIIGMEVPSGDLPSDDDPVVLELTRRAKALAA